MTAERGDSMYSKIYKYTINAVTASPLHIGSAAGEAGEVLIHPVTGLPFIQASSIVGVLRTVSEKVNSPAVTSKLFGSARSAAPEREGDGCLKFSDAEFKQKTVKMELRPRVKIDPVTGTVNSEKVSGSGAVSGQKFETEFIGAGAEFSFTVYLFAENDEYVKALEKVIQGFAGAQIGGQKSNGAGFIRLEEVYRKDFDLSTEEGLDAWLNHSEEADNGTKLTDFADLPANNGWYIITVTGKTEGELLVKSSFVEGFGADAPDAENIRNAADEYIIPGSSFKGALRNRVSYIAGKLKKRELVEEIFGRSGDDDNSGAARGKVVVRDIPIKVSKDTKDYIQHRIHIDKFTGGVMHGQKFSESPIGGDLNITICVEDGEKAKAAVGLIVLAIRDLASGLWNIGSGYNIGRGFIDVNSMTIKGPVTEGEAWKISFDASDQNGEAIRKISENFLGAVKEASVSNE